MGRRNFRISNCGDLIICQEIKNHTQFEFIDEEGCDAHIDELVSSKADSQQTLSTNDPKAYHDAEQFRTIFDKAAVGIAIINLQDSRIMTCNPALQQMLGYDADELKTKTFHDITYPEDVGEDLANADDLVKGDVDHYYLERRYVRKDGSIIWGHLTSTIAFDTDGKPLYGIGMIEDITERKVAEEYLKKYQMLSENSRDIVLFIRQSDGRIIEANNAAVRAYGYTREELLSLTIYDLRAPEAVILTNTQMVKADSEGILFETKHKRKDGSKFDVEVSSRGTDVGDQRVLLSIIRDITDRKRAEDALRQSEERLKRAQEIAHLGSWELDLVKNELTWSDEVYRIFGLKPQEFAGTYEAFLERVHPDDRAMVDEAYTRSLREGRDTYEIEHRIIRKSTGEIRWVHEKCEHIRNADGNIVFSYGMVLDITERKEGELEQKGRLHREQRIASTLQQALVPSYVPEEINGYKFAATYRPALKEAEVGGDFYDIFDLGDGRVCVLIGDVSGKGLQAAIRVAAARYAIRSYAFIDTRPSRILTLANSSLCCTTDEERDMLTAFLAIIDTRIGAVIYSNAGHEPPLVLHPDGTIEELQATGAPLGVLPDVIYTEDACKLDPGSRILMVTDGITEARTPEVVLFGKERVTDYFSNNSALSLQDLVEGLLHAASAHAGGELQDDAAIVIVEKMYKRRKPTVSS